jgi:aspartate aminotransferase
VVNGVSKSYAMTGWRIGYAAGPAPVIKAMTNIQSQSTSNPASIAQWAALEALTGPQDSVEEMRREFDARRRYLVQALNAVRGITCLSPGGAFYVFPNTSALYGGRVKGSLELAAYLLEEAGVALVPGEAFGDDNFVRISYATAMEDIKRAVQRIGAAVAKL